jgi:hypothetical protein
MGHHQECQNTHNGSSKRGGDRGERIFEEIMVEKHPDLILKN